MLNWLYARHSHGRFVLRIEDTDVDRNLPDSEASMMASLRRLGIEWDEGPDIGGEYGPYVMSRFTTETAGRCRLYYTMSTWNPYQVVVMQSDFRLECR